jgi:hypothetical protein
MWLVHLSNQPKKKMKNEKRRKKTPDTLVCGFERLSGVQRW